MHVLFLGQECSSIENALIHAGHRVTRQEEAFNITLLEEQQFDFAVSYRFRHIIRSPEIAWFNGKLINLHISYLPWNRGADPNFWSWLDNTPKGVTIHRIDDGIDTGDILLQQCVSFDVNAETLRTSYETLSRTLENMFITNFPALLAGNIHPQQQQGLGSYHTSRDKIPFLHMIEKKWWETPVTALNKERENSLRYKYAK